MSTEEITLILSYVGSFGVGATIAGSLVYFSLKSFILSYVSKKAENLATREDIARITEEIERVKSQYALVIEELRARHQLRLAAVDRRLEAHQRAYSLWQKLLSNVHGGPIVDVVAECQEWWNNNCLYLNVDARRAFFIAVNRALSHRNYTSAPAPQRNTKLLTRQQNSGQIDYAA